VLWGDLSWKDALAVFCTWQTEMIVAFLNERGIMAGNVIVDSELEVLKMIYIWRKGGLFGWLKRHSFEHLPNTTRAVVVWIMWWKC